MKFVTEEQEKLTQNHNKADEDIKKLKRAESELIPDDFEYETVPGLRIEIKEKLKRFKPYSLGHASRIPGITPSAISLLSVFIKRHNDEIKKCA